MTLYSAIVSRIDRVIAGVESQVTDDLKYDSVCAALDVMLPWQAKRSTQTLTGDGSATSFALESDLYEIDAVVLDETGELLSLAMLSPGLYRGDNMAGDNDWLEFPSGYLSFSKAIDSGDTVTVYYRAHWDKPEDADDADFELTIPAFLEQPLVYYASAYCITPESITTATVRQYATKIDAGTPVHNPLSDSVKFLLTLFNDIMNSHPKQLIGSRV